MATTSSNSPFRRKPYFGAGEIDIAPLVKSAQCTNILIAALVALGFGLLTTAALEYLARRDQRVPEVAQPASADVAAPPKNSQNANILVAAVVAFSFGLLTNVVSNYLNRRDQHVQEADKCTSLIASLITTTSLVQEFADSARVLVAAPLQRNKQSNKFSLPPFDEILHSQDAALTILDAPSRDSVLRVEATYRTIRDDLANTPGNYHTGETFGVPPSSGNQGAYEKLLSLLARGAESANHVLHTSNHCKSLAKTNFFWQSMRKGG